MNGKTKSSHGGRLSSFEAVRIVAILMVLVVHCVRNKFEVTDPHTLAIECGWLSWEECVMASFGILGVNLFILISGWFGIRLSARGVFGIFFVIIFYRLLIGIFFLSAGVAPVKEFLLFIVPTYLDWFSGAYVLLMFITPMINHYIEHHRRSAVKLVGGAFCFIWLCGWLVNTQPDNRMEYNLVIVVLMYAVGRILRFGYDGGRWHCSPRRLLACTVLILAVSGTVWFVLTRYVDSIGFGWWLNRIMLSRFNPVNIAASIMIVLAAARLNFRSKAVNSVAGAAFAVYLIHCNPFVFPYYKEVAIRLFDTGSAMFYPFGVLAFAIATYMVSWLIDRVRMLAQQRFETAGTALRLSTAFNRAVAWLE